MIDVLLFIIALVWLIFASASDLKTREVPDWLSYSLIIIGFGNALLKSLILGDIKFLFYSLAAFSLVFLFSALLYYTKQWGGGDVKLIAGLVTLFPVYPEELLNYFGPNLDIPFILILFLNIIIFGALYSIVYGIYLLIKNKIDFLNEIKKYDIKKIYLISPLVTLIISIFTKDLFLKLFLLSIGILILITPMLTVFVKIVEKKCMFKKIPVKKLTEGDWINKNIYYKNKLIYNKNSPGITKLQIVLIKKTKLKDVIVKEGVPFIPSFLIAFLISIIIGNLFKI
ncbi:MAG: A24 family peptidase [Nanoarchaeota archaeon]